MNCTDEALRALEVAKKILGPEAMVETLVRVGPDGVERRWYIGRMRRGGLRLMGHGPDLNDAIKAAADRQARGEE